MYEVVRTATVSILERLGCLSFLSAFASKASGIAFFQTCASNAPRFPISVFSNPTTRETVVFG